MQKHFYVVVRGGEVVRINVLSFNRPHGNVIDFKKYAFIVEEGQQFLKKDSKYNLPDAAIRK